MRLCGMATGRLGTFVTGAVMGMGLAGCAYKPPSAPVAALDFPRAGAILSGFDAYKDQPTSQPIQIRPLAGADWHVGDQVLFGLAIDEDGARSVAYVRIELLTPPLTPGRDVRVQFYSGPHPPLVAPPEQPANPVNTEPFIVWRPASEVPPGAGEQLTSGGPAPQRFRTQVWESEFKARVGGQDRVVRHVSDPILVALHMYDGEGRFQKTGYTLVPEKLLRTSIYAACQVGVRFSDAPDKSKFTLSDDELAALSSVHAALTAIGQTLWRADASAPLFERIVPPPPLLSVVFRGGIEVAIRMGVDQATPASNLESEFEVAADRRDHAAPAHDAFSFPLTITINDAESLQCRLAAAPPSSPYALAAGILQLRGETLRGSQKRFELRLLAARRGVP